MGEKSLTKTFSSHFVRVEDNEVHTLLFIRHFATDAKRQEGDDSQR